jgi:hypothetical protein
LIFVGQHSQPLGNDRFPIAAVTAAEQMFGADEQIREGGNHYISEVAATNAVNPFHPNLQRKEMKKLLTTAAVLATTLTTLATATIAQQAKLPTPESGNYNQFCTEKWTKRGALNIEMFNYCMRRQAEGDRTLADLAAKHSSLPWAGKSSSYRRSVTWRDTIVARTGCPPSHRNGPPMCFFGAFVGHAPDT